MHHVTLTVISKYGGEAISVVDSYVSDIYSSMVKNNIKVINSFRGNALRHYPTSNATVQEEALIIQGTTEDLNGAAHIIAEFRDAPIVIHVMSY